VFAKSWRRESIVSGCQLRNSKLTGQIHTYNFKGGSNNIIYKAFNTLCIYSVKVKYINQSWSLS
jgi:hypothetical protein